VRLDPAARKRRKRPNQARSSPTPRGRMPGTRAPKIREGCDDAPALACPPVSPPPGRPARDHHVSKSLRKCAADGRPAGSPQAHPAFGRAVAGGRWKHVREPRLPPRGPARHTPSGLLIPDRHPSVPRTLPQGSATGRAHRAVPLTLSGTSPASRRHCQAAWSLVQVTPQAVGRATSPLRGAPPRRRDRRILSGWERLALVATRGPKGVPLGSTRVDPGLAPVRTGALKHA
jgi:hypothetical protein